MATIKKPIKETRRESASKFIKEHYQGEQTHKFERPKIRIDYFKDQRVQVALVVIFVAILTVSGVLFYLQSKKQVAKVVENQAKELSGGWFAVKLLNGESVYGKIDSMKTDPIVINPVYYNYEQVRDGAELNQKINEAGDLRLVKRGQETHGPDGALEVFKSQFVYMERLKNESKVLQAILENEK